MKKLSLFFVGVLFSTLVFANGTDESSTKSSSVAVINPNGANLFKVYYKSTHRNDVKISIYDDRGNLVMKEKIKNLDGFVRPYNFEGMTEGVYTIKVEDEGGKMVERIQLGAGKVEKLIAVKKVFGTSDKYLLTIQARKQGHVHINIYDKFHELSYSEDQTINGEFGKVYDLRELKTFTIEVTDGSGLLKSVKY